MKSIMNSGKKWVVAGLFAVALTMGGCGDYAESAAGTAGSNAGAGRSVQAATKTKAQEPAGLHIKSPESGADAKATPGLYLDNQLLAAGATDAKISPDGMLAVWQSGTNVQLYSLRSHKQRTIASNLPAPISTVEWGNHYFKLKLANTGEFVVDNIE